MSRVIFESREYVNSHRRMPWGEGNWTFTAGKLGTVTIFGNFGDAKLQAIKTFRTRAAAARNVRGIIIKVQP